jgi:transposase
MTLQPEDFTCIPEETIRVAKAAFPKGNAYIKLRDELSTIYRDEQFKRLFPNVGQGAQSPGRLALVCVLQFAKGLSDRQAAEAVRSRIDWKYMLGLGLEDPGFDFSVLGEFRGRLIAGGVEEQVLNTLLEVLQAHKLIKERSRVRTDSTHILAAIRRVNRLEKVGETLRFALDTLAGVAPDWLRERAPESWYLRYGVRLEAWRMPKKEDEQTALALQIGKMGTNCWSGCMRRIVPRKFVRIRWWRSSGGFGSRSITNRMGRLSGGDRTIFRLGKSASPPHMIPRCVTVKSGGRIGSDTKCITLKPARKTLTRRAGL